MGKLSQYTDSIGNIQNRLDEADSIKKDSTAFLNDRFDQSDKKMGESLKGVMKEQSEQAVFAAALHQTVLQVAQNNQMMLHNMLNDLKVLERQANENRGKVKADVSTFKGDVSKGQKNVQSKLDKLSSDVAKIPTLIPEPEKVDLSGLDKAMMALGLQVDNIPTAKFPDMSGNFSRISKEITALKKTLSTRVHVFDIERENDLVKRIVVRTK